MSAREQIWPSFNGVRIWSEAGKGSRAKVVEKGGEKEITGQDWLWLANMGGH